MAKGPNENGLRQVPAMPLPTLEFCQSDSFKMGMGLLSVSKEWDP